MGVSLATYTKRQQYIFHKIFDYSHILIFIYLKLKRYGLMLPAGVISHTGVGGLSLYGGYGWFGRQYGLTVDHILEVDLVTYDGSLLVVNKDNHPV